MGGIGAEDANAIDMHTTFCTRTHAADALQQYGLASAVAAKKAGDGATGSTYGRAGEYLPGAGRDKYPLGREDIGGDYISAVSHSEQVNKIISSRNQTENNSARGVCKL